VGVIVGTPTTAHCIKSHTNYIEVKYSFLKLSDILTDARTTAAPQPLAGREYNQVTAVSTWLLSA